jgi:hypothetical protein
MKPLSFSLITVLFSTCTLAPIGASAQPQQTCAAITGYPLGRWQVGTRGATPATYSTFITFTTPTSGTWLPSSGKGTFQSSIPPKPGEAVSINLNVEGSAYTSENQLVVSPDGCRMTGTFLDSEGHRGEAIYRWQGVQ